MAMKNNIVNIAVADDHPIFRQALVNIIEQNPRYKVVAQAANGAEALQAVQQHKPDILFLDIQMPLMNGLEVLAELKHKKNALRIIVLSIFHAADFQTYLLAQKISGVLSKNAEPAEIHTAIENVMQGICHAPHEILNRFLPGTEKHGTPVYSESDIQLVELSMRKVKTEEIAKQLHKSASEVEKHRTELIRQSGSAGFVELVHRLTAQGFLQHSQ